MASEPSKPSRRTDGDRSHESDDTREALLDATIELVADRGPDGFSSREVAKAAGVNYGLIHYHFGSKSELVRLAIARELGAWAASALNKDSTEWTPLLVNDPPSERAWRLLVHVSMNWERYRDAIDEFPLLRHRLEVLGAHFGDTLDTSRLKAALIASTCLQIGWLALSEWHLASVDASDEERTTIKSFLEDVERSILDIAFGRPNGSTSGPAQAD